MVEHTLSAQVGNRIELPEHFDVPVTLEAVRPLGADSGAGYECRVRLPDGTLEETIISAAEATRIFGAGAARTNERTASHPADSERLRLLVESTRIRLAYAYDRQFAVSLSGIRTLPHQIEAVYRKMLPQPRLRFLLADDPGAGKTIMAGLLIKELKLREAIDRCLILVPAPLTIQWQDELLRFFNEPFQIIHSANDQQQLLNLWEREAQIVCSIDYAKQDDVRERVWQQQWDLVIIDEAHKCSAYTRHSAGRGDEVQRTKRYQLAERLSEHCDNLLLLTATPHHGDDDRFAHFIRLIDRDLFPEPHRLGEEARRVRRDILQLGENCPWSLRRLKEDLKDLHGRRLFPDRHVHTVSFQLGPQEYAIYKAVTAYINEFLPQAAGPRKTSVALVRTVFQRRLASSTRAIHESLRRRAARLEELVAELEQLSPSQRARRLAQLAGRLVDAEQDEDDLDEGTRDALIDEATAAVELDHLRTEIAALRELSTHVGRVRENGRDSKLVALRECLERAEFDDLKDGRGKLLIFTEHRDTLSHLRQHLESWGYSTCEIHGGMNPHERKQAQEDFRTNRQVCVATEAAGEGINLQFCHLMVNYDLPWNPTRLEQRLGRIHRIGQSRDVYAFNFVATSSEDGQPVIEGRILERLLSKLDRMRDALGDRVFDVVGEVLSLNRVNLPEMLREVAYEPRRLDDYLDVIERIDPRQLELYEDATGIALARAHVDFSTFARANLEAEERRLMPRYVEAHFLNAAKAVGLRTDARADGLWRIEHVLADLRSERLGAVRRLGKPDATYRKLTFYKEHLIGIGGSLAAPPLPHHRAYGSVHGGSMELSGWVAPDQGDETEPNEKGIGQANGQCRAVAEPPGTARTTSGLGRQVLANAQATQRRKTPAPTLPLTPDGGTKPTPYPLVEAAQHRGGLAEPEVAPPSNEVARQLRNKTRETDALRAARQLPNPRLEPCQRLRRKAPPGPPTNREAEAQKAAPRRTSHRALGRVHPQSQTPGKEACHACHHPLARPPRPHVDVAVVGVAHEAMAATLQLLVHNVQHQVRQQRRQRAALRRPFDSRTHQTAHQSARAQKAANHPEQASVRHPLGHQTHHDVVAHLVKELLQVQINHDAKARADMVLRTLHRLMGRASGTKPVARIRKAGVPLPL